MHSPVTLQVFNIMSGLSRSEQRQISAAVKASIASSGKSSTPSSTKKGKGVSASSTIIFIEELWIFDVHELLMDFLSSDHLRLLKARPLDLGKNLRRPKSVKERHTQAAEAAAAAAAAVMRCCILEIVKHISDIALF